VRLSTAHLNRLLVLGILGFEKWHSIPEEINKEVEKKVQNEVHQKVGPQIITEIEQRRRNIEIDELIAKKAAESFGTNGLVNLLERIHVHPQTGELSITANPELGGNRCTTTIEYGEGQNKRHVQFEQGGHIEDYGGAWVTTKGSKKT
jgi:hypothetical protein